MNGPGIGGGIKEGSLGGETREELAAVQEEAGEKMDEVLYEATKKEMTEFLGEVEAQIKEFETDFASMCPTEFAAYQAEVAKAEGK